MWFVVLAALASDRIDGVPAEAAQQIWQVELLRLPVASLGIYLSSEDPTVRARAARAAGRLRDVDALTALSTLAADPAAEVRREAAFALGQTPGTGEVLGRRWATETDAGARRTLAIALGKQGGPEAVDILVEALKGPASVEAAEGLGRLAMRKVEGAQADRVVAALLDTLRVPVGDTRRRAAWALARAGLVRTSDENALRMRRAVLEDGDGLVKAWLIRAWSGVAAEAARAEVLLRTAADPDPGVRIATARAVAKQGLAGAGPLLVKLLASPEVEVRLEAILAVAACPGLDARGLLSRSWDSDDPVERAAVLRVLVKQGSLGRPLQEFLAADQPLAVRIAAVESLTDRNKLLALALRSEEPPLRSAAAATLLAAEAPRLPELLELLRAKDTLLAQAAAETLKDHPDPGAERALLDLLARRDLAPETAELAVRALDAIYATGRLRRPDPDAAAVLRPWLRMRRLADVTPRFADLLAVDVPRERHPVTRIPDLREVLAIRSARIYTSEGEIRVDFDTAEAPYTVWNFATLAEQGYFDGHVFHRVVPDFVIQTGDPRGDGWGGPGYEIPDEINPVPYGAGVVGMALSGPDTGGSQWFVTLSPQPHLDGTYTVFGHVTSGMRAARGIGIGDRIERVVIERVPYGPS